MCKITYLLPYSFVYSTWPKEGNIFHILLKKFSPHISKIFHLTLHMSLLYTDKLENYNYCQLQKRTSM